MNIHEGVPVLDPEEDKKGTEEENILSEEEAANYINGLAHDDGFMPIKDAMELGFKHIDNKKEELEDKRREEEKRKREEEENIMFGLHNAFSNIQKEKPRGEPAKKPVLNSVSVHEVEKEEIVTAPESKKYTFENLPQIKVMERIGKAVEHAREQTKETGESDYSSDKLMELYGILQRRAKIEEDYGTLISKIDGSILSPSKRMAFEISTEDKDLIEKISKEYRDFVPKNFNNN